MVTLTRLSNVNGAATPAPGVATICNQWATQIENDNATLGGHTTGIAALQPVPVNLTLANLRQAYSTNVTAAPLANTIDCGMCQYSQGSGTWFPIHPFVVYQSAIPFIVPSSGSVANNGVLTLTTALPRTYASCYMYFQPGALYSGSSPGFYYTIMSSGTAGVVYLNIYMGLQAAVPTTLTPIVATGPGAYTQLTGISIFMANGVVPGNVMNANGMVEYRYTTRTPNNGNNKSVTCNWGGNNIANDVTTVETWRQLWRMVQNSGATNLQTVFSSANGGAPGTGTNITNQTVNTLIGQNANIACSLTVATDYVILESASITVTPSAVLDAQITPSIFIPSPSIIPPGAAALGFTTNTWMAFPKVSDVSFNLSDTTHKLYAGQWYNVNPPYSPSGGYLQDTTIGGTSYLQINQLGDGTNAGVCTQNQSSIAGLLRHASASAGFYYEVARTLQTPNGFNTDNFPGIFINPTEHNAVNGAAFPYLECDIDEGWVFSLNGNNPYFGSCNSLVDWTTGSGGTGTTINNANLANAGPYINRNQENVHGFSLDPVSQTVNWWLNGNLQYQKSIATQISGGRVLGRHYYLIFGASSRSRAVNPLLAYSALYRYAALWGG